MILFMIYFFSIFRDENIHKRINYLLTRPIKELYSINADFELNEYLENPEIAQNSNLCKKITAKTAEIEDLRTEKSDIITFLLYLDYVCFSKQIQWELDTSHKDWSCMCFFNVRPYTSKCRISSYVFVKTFLKHVVKVHSAVLKSPETVTHSKLDWFNNKCGKLSFKHLKKRDIDYQNYFEIFGKDESTTESSNHHNWPPPSSSTSTQHENNSLFGNIYLYIFLYIYIYIYIFSIVSKIFYPFN